MIYMNNAQCREKIADCCKITRGELSRWSGKSLSDDDLKEHYNSNNWTRHYQNTIKGVTTRGYRFNKFGLRVDGTIVSRHSGYSVSVSLWAPMTLLDEPDASVFGNYEKK